MKRLLSLVKKAAVVGVSSMVVSAAHAQVAIDTAAAETQITNAGTAVAAVGGALIVLAGISMAYRWVKATFF